MIINELTQCSRSLLIAFIVVCFHVGHNPNQPWSGSEETGDNTESLQMDIADEFPDLFLFSWYLMITLQNQTTAVLITKVLPCLFGLVLFIPKRSL